MTSMRKITTIEKQLTRSNTGDIQVVRVGRNERIEDQPLSFSRHYTSDSSRSSSLTKYDRRHARRSQSKENFTGDRKRKPKQSSDHEVRHFVERSPYLIPSTNEGVEVMKLNARASKRQDPGI
jgi:hypothetical protein